ncbi:MAG: hypothetical protein KatS3mg038_2160 [Candidatus Kapaibacterium sp.]|nr:MAG: hypothetical protein KatS3mg038_2160 [Candidatus Kapabacteria bacterium]
MPGCDNRTVVVSERRPVIVNRQIGTVVESAGVTVVTNTAVQVHTFVTPAYSHTAVHNLGRLPQVTVYTMGGVEVLATVVSTISTTTVMFDSVPQSCIIIIS